MSREAVNSMTDGERLVRLEEKMETVIQNTEKMNQNFDNFTNTFVPRKELELMLEQRDREIENIKQDQEAAERNKWSLRSMWPAWLGVGIAAFSLLKDFI